MGTKLIYVAALIGASFASERAARADEYAGRRLNNLHNDVAVRHRRLLVANRFELAPLFESTINAEFQHIIGGGAKLEYHIGDMLSIGVVGIGSTQFNTKLTDRIVPTLEDNTNTATREPSKDEFTLRLNKMPVHGAAYLSITPWYGKLAAFSAAYVAFDFYFQAGVSYAQLTNAWPNPAPCMPTTPATTFCEDPDPGKPRPGPMGEALPPDNNPNNDDPLNSGTRIGLYLGGGIHVFLSDFLALDLSVRDYAFSDNPSGADYNADLFVGHNELTGGDDNRFLHHLFFGAGISIMIPFTVKRTP
jgi:outer membrane beta-barrel protein